ncbi:MAG: hypothetical protein AAF192_14155 [Pseudomonadota bacterium]
MPAPPRRDVTLYTRTVRRLKILLPLVALALLSMLFLFPREARFDGGVVYTSADLLALGEGLAVTSPSISGATEAGEPFVVVADRAVPDGPDPSLITLDVVRAEFEQAEGRKLELSAEAGTLRPKDQTLALAGRVRLTTSDGYRVATEAVEADLAAGEVRAPGPVRAEGPQGFIEAGRFRATRSPRKDPGSDDADALGEPAAGDYLWFEGGVTVRWDPQAPTPGE